MKQRRIGKIVIFLRKIMPFWWFPVGGRDIVRPGSDSVLELS
jgi:hypothetical protein